MAPASRTAAYHLRGERWVEFWSAPLTPELVPSEVICAPGALTHAPSRPATFILVFLAPP